jgi:hypothetical protein
MRLTAESLFRDAFLPLYPPEARADLARARTTDANPGGNPAVPAHLADAARVFAGMGHGVFGRELGLDFSADSVHRLGAAMTRGWRDALVAKGGLGTPVCELFNVVVHGAAYVGECIVRSREGLWGVRQPLWESVVHLVSHAGEAELPVFHWWLKSLADDAFADDGAPRAGLAERYRAHVEACFAPTGLEAIAPADRALPRIAKSVRYDVLHQWIKAHLPELKDVGRDFPSPERWDAYRFAWLEGRLVGGGTTLVLAGRGEGGLHVLWLTKQGFAKAAHFAAEASPEPTIAEEGDKLVFHVTHAGKALRHETMWWGP